MKVIGVAISDGGEFVLPSSETVNNGAYPVARDLYMYSNGTPTGIIKDYLDWLLTPEAQNIVTELGFVAIAE